jgi:transposase
MTLKSNTGKTGLVCPQCRQPVAVIENQLPRVFWCPACGHRWSADAPGTPKQ